MNPKPVFIRGIALAAPRPVADVEPGPAWMSAPDRKCAPIDGEILAGFTSDDRYVRRDAATICVRRCAYRWPCLEWAVKHDERHGIWGGVDFDSETDRKAARAKVEAWRAAQLEVTADVDYYGEEVTWLISRWRTNLQIAQALHITEERVAAMRERLDRTSAVAA